MWGEFLSKHVDEAVDFLNYVAETGSKGSRKIKALEPSKGGMYALPEDTEMKEKWAILT